MPFCKHSESIQQAPKKNAFINELIGYRETCKQVVLKIRVCCLILFQTYDSYEMTSSFETDLFDGDVRWQNHWSEPQSLWKSNLMQFQYDWGF